MNTDNLRGQAAISLSVDSDPLQPGHATTPERDADRVRTLAFQQGYSLAGIGEIGPHSEHVHLKEFLDRGYAGTMDYLRKTAEKRMDPREVSSWARSALVVGLIYDTPFPHTDALLDPESDQAYPDADERLWISRYAWGRDYHHVLTRMNRKLVRQLKEAFGPDHDFRQWVDTGPLMEKVLATHAGLGWMAKNTLVVNPLVGSWFFLGVILTSLDLQPTGEVADHCGSCTACLDVCPTDAFVEPYVLDATRCISYRTIETREDVLPTDQGPGLSPHLFGCDLCQDVCPFNRKSPMTTLNDFYPRNLGEAPLRKHVDAFLAQPDQARLRLAGTPIGRTGPEGLQRTVDWIDEIRAKDGPSE